MEPNGGVLRPSPLPRPTTADVRQSTLEKFVTLIEKEPNMRPDFECHEFIPFLRKHIEWFNSLKPELIQEIIKRCKYERLYPDSVFIKQGDLGDSMYAILRGTVGVHVIFDSENERECLARVEAAMNKKKFNKNDLGNEVAQIPGGSCIGEVALISENCMRTATCVSNSLCDFLVIDRELYSVSVKEFIEKEFNDKKQFVERNPLFKSWPHKQRNQLIISLKKKRIGFCEKLIRQGQELDDVFFIYRGDIEIHIDSKLYEKEYPLLYSEMKSLLPELIKRPRRPSQAPHQLRKERMAASKTQKICILGANETVGSVEALLGLDCYLQTAVASADCELMVLKKTQFERAFKRKTAASTLDKLKDILGNKLCLYIYQSDPSSVSFLKYLNIKLMDPHVVHEIKKNKQRKGKHDEAYIGAEKMTKSVDEQEIVNLLKKLHMNTDSATELPPEDMTEMALAKLDRRMRIWSENSNMNGSRLAELKSSSICLSDNRDVSH